MSADGVERRWRVRGMGRRPSRHRRIADHLAAGLDPQPVEAEPVGPDAWARWAQQLAADCSDLVSAALHPCTHSVEWTGTVTMTMVPPPGGRQIGRGA